MKIYSTNLFDKTCKNFYIGTRLKLNSNVEVPHEVDDSLKFTENSIFICIDIRVAWEVSGTLFWLLMVGIDIEFYWSKQKI